MLINIINLEVTMNIIIISVILTIVTAFVLGLKSSDNHKGLVYKPSLRQLFSLIWLVLILFAFITIIPANSVGIEYNPFKGGIQQITLQEGFKFKNPLTKIYIISNKVKELQFDNVSVQTNDSQWVNAIIQVQVNIDKNKANIYFSKYGDKELEDIRNIISSTIQKQFESVTVKYNIMELLGEKRDDIVNETYKLAAEELYKDGIILNRLILIDTDAGDEIERAISEEAVAKKNVDTAEYKKQQAELEGEAKVIEAKKQKEANDLLNKSLTEEILTEQFIEKWNGELPKVTGTNNIMDITSFLK